MKGPGHSGRIGDREGGVGLLHDQLGHRPDVEHQRSHAGSAPRSSAGPAASRRTGLRSATRSGGGSAPAPPRPPAAAAEALARVDGILRSGGFPHRLFGPVTLFGIQLPGAREPGILEVARREGPEAEQTHAEGERDRPRAREMAAHGGPPVRAWLDEWTVESIPVLTDEAVRTLRPPRVAVLGHPEPAADQNRTAAAPLTLRPRAGNPYTGS